MEKNSSTSSSEQVQTKQKIVSMSQLDESKVGQVIRVRGFLHNKRIKGARDFFVLRQGRETVQVVLEKKGKDVEVTNEEKEKLEKEEYEININNSNFILK